MAASIVNIVNRALDHIGQQTLVSFDDPGPNPARIRRLWPQVRDAVLREHNWKSATKRIKLNELLAKPAFGFDRRYQLPPDFLRLVDTYPAGVKVEVEGDCLLADEKELFIAYVARVDDPSLFDTSLKDVLSLKLAAELAYGISASVTLAGQLEDKYRQRLKEARGHDAREGDSLRTGLGAWARAKLGY